MEVTSKAEQSPRKFLGGRGAQGGENKAPTAIREVYLLLTSPWEGHDSVECEVRIYLRKTE